MSARFRPSSCACSSLTSPASLFLSISTHACSPSPAGQMRPTCPADSSRQISRAATESACAVARYNCLRSAETTQEVTSPAGVTSANEASAPTGRPAFRARPSALTPYKRLSAVIIQATRADQAALITARTPSGDVMRMEPLESARYTKLGPSGTNLTWVTPHAASPWYVTPMLR